MSTRHRAPTVSLVVPVFNEEAAISTFCAAIEQTVVALADTDFELIFVDDGSADTTLDQLKHAVEPFPDACVIELSRNFGKEAAIAAGLAEARGDCAIIMDVDLQDPPELIPQMLAHWRDGAEVVVAIRTDRSSDRVSRRVSARLFYRLYNSLSEIKITPGSGDYRLMDRCVVDAFLRMPERNRFNKGLFAWLGFRQVTIEHVRPKASRPGSRWGTLRLLGYALDGIFSFTSFPIRVWSYIGSIIAFITMAYGLYLVQRTLFHGADIPGYTSTFVAVVFLGGLNLLMMGLLGEYIGRILIEAKQRPLYVVRRRHHSRSQPTVGPMETRRAAAKDDKRVPES